MIRRVTVGQRLRSLREATGMTQGQLGTLMRTPISHAAVSDIERGVTRLDVERLSELVAILGGDLMELTQPEAPTASEVALAAATAREAALTADRDRWRNRALAMHRQAKREQSRKAILDQGWRSSRDLLRSRLAEVEAGRSAIYIEMEKIEANERTEQAEARGDLTRLRTIETAARKYVQALDALDPDTNPDVFDSDFDLRCKHRNETHDALVAAVGDADANTH